MGVFNDVVQKGSKASKFAYRIFEQNGIDKITLKNEVKIVPTVISQGKYKGQESKSSLSYGNVCEDKAKIIKTVFEIKDTDKFDTHLSQSTKGQGKECNNITVLHSSALLSLLCFYKTKEFPFKYKGLKYKGIRFEYSNNLWDISNNQEYTQYVLSNIDVALFDDDCIEKSSNVLFLESKFTEPLNGGKKDNISWDVYNKIYEQLREYLERMKLNISNPIDGYFTLGYDNRPAPYCEGIKQMISHFLGAVTFANSFEGEKVYLGTILYKFDEYDNDNNSYPNLYSKLANALNALIKNNEKFIKIKDKLEILEKPLYYQDVFKEYPLDDNVARFYSLGKYSNK